MDMTHAQDVFNPFYSTNYPTTSPTMAHEPSEKSNLPWPSDEPRREDGDEGMRSVLGIWDHCTYWVPRLLVWV